MLFLKTKFNVPIFKNIYEQNPTMDPSSPITKNILAIVALSMKYWKISTIS